LAFADGRILNRWSLGSKGHIMGIELKTAYIIFLTIVISSVGKISVSGLQEVCVYGEED
jgi:hypothetical protein